MALQGPHHVWCTSMTARREKGERETMLRGKESEEGGKKQMRERGAGGGGEGGKGCTVDECRKASRGARFHVSLQ